MKSNTENLINEFKEKVQNLQEVDIGDFRRRLSVYIYRLNEDLSTNDPKKKQSLNQMKNIALYEDYRDIEEIRQLIVNEIKNFEK